MSGRHLPMSARLRRCFCRGPGGIVVHLVYILCVCEVQVLFIDQIKLSFVKAQKMASKKKLVLQKNAPKKLVSLNL